MAATATTWGPRWHTVMGEGGQVKRVVRVGGSASQPGGTWPYLALLATRSPLQGDESGGDKRARGELAPPPWPAQLGLSLEVVEKQLRLRLRARVAARLAKARTSQRAGDVAAREAEIVATAADVVAYRAQRGWSQRDLAAAVGVSRGIVCECERGQRPGLRVREWVDSQLAGAR